MAAMIDAVLRHLPIGTKLLLPPIVGLAMMGLLAAGGWTLISHQRVALVQRVDRAIAMDRAVAEIPASLAHIQCSLYKLSAWSAIGVRGEEMRRTRAQLGGELAVLLGEVSRLSLGDDELTARFRDQLTLYEEEIRAAITLSERNPVLASTAARGTERPYEELEASGRAILEAWGRSFAAEARRADERARALGSAFLGMAALAAGVTLVFAVAVGRRITGPILALVGAIERLRGGELAIQVPETGRGDEIGLVAQAIADFRVSLSRTRALEAQRSGFVAELERLAYRDPLTGLRNRAMFQRDMQDAFAAGPGASPGPTLLMLDLDHFKEVNDTLGHEAGDVLLRQVAERLRASMRGEDRLYRLGGDEFAVILEGKVGARAAAQTAQRLIDAIGRPFDLAGQEARVGASAGISRASSAAAGPGDAVRHADLALYEAKASGRNAYSFFEDRMNDAAVRRQFIERELRDALARDVLRLHFQPQVDLATGLITGAEALLRWRHETEGCIPPAEFVPVAERSGLIDQLGTFVLRAACRQVRAWRDAGLRPPPVAVNVSPAQFRTAGFLDGALACLHESDIPASAIVLELTESIFVDVTAGAVIGQLERLRACGFSLALDDFGTGYSSLGYLRKLPLGELKVDAGFVRELEHAEDARKLTAGIVALGHSLGLRVIAEGVETEGQVAALRHMRCDVGQGYLFAHPLPPEDLGPLFASGRTWPAREAAA